MENGNVGRKLVSFGSSFGEIVVVLSNLTEFDRRSRLLNYFCLVLHYIIWIVLFNKIIPFIF